MAFGASSEMETNVGLGSPNSSDSLTESYSFDDTIVRQFTLATLVWALLATLAGLLVALLLVMPRLFEAIPWLTFGRLRPMHTNTALFAFVGNGLFAAIYYSTQRLCKARMWSTALSQAHFWSWQVIVLVSALTFPLAITQGKEHAEMEWPIDLAIAVVWIGFFGVNVVMTMLNRREPRLYLSLWFYLASIVAVSIVHVVNNLVVPLGWGKSYSVFSGSQDALLHWWYGHNLLVFLLMMPLLGLMYYFVPKVAERPIYSYRLVIIHFWAMVGLAVWAGPWHLHYMAIPEWTSSLGMVFGLMLWVPAWGGVINGLMTLRKHPPQPNELDNASDVPVKRRQPAVGFFMASLVCYALVALEEAALSIKSVQAWVQFSDWMIAHMHLLTLGWAGLLAFGMIYWLAPRLFQTALWSPMAAKLHLWIAISGLLLYAVPIYIAGAWQALMWRSTTELGTLAYPEFFETIAKVDALWWLRLAGGVIYTVGIVLMAVNYAMTWKARPRKYKVPVHRAPPMIESDAPLAQESSRLDEAPVLDTARRLDIWSRLHWHRRWERWPMRFIGLIAVAVAAAGLVEVGPAVMLPSQIPPLKTVEPYTPLELAGRDLYIAEGCINCHSQIVRPLLADTKRFGEYSVAGEFVYDHPFQWGSRRIGSDLARQGGRQSSLWLWQHLDDPTVHQPGTVMPSYVHLLDTPIDYDTIPDRVHAAYMLGVPYDRALDDSIAMAKEQAERVAADIVSQGGSIRRGELMTLDSQAVALIAYLQRLGTDRFAAPDSPETSQGEVNAETSQGEVNAETSQGEVNASDDETEE